MNPMAMGFYGAFPVMFCVVFLLVIFIIGGTILQNLKQNHSNNNSPRVTAEATVVTKRTHVRGDHARTTYYATFQFASGDRLELMIPYDHFGYLVEGDKGKLTFQGTRFLEFHRTL